METYKVYEVTVYNKGLDKETVVFRTVSESEANKMNFHLSDALSRSNSLSVYLKVVSLVVTE